MYEKTGADQVPREVRRGTMTHMRISALFLMVLVHTSVISAGQSKSAVLLETAVIGKDNRVHLRWTGRKETIEPPGEEQVGISDLQIASYKQAVGWTVERSGDDFGTNYPMSLELIVIWEGSRRYHIFPGATIGPWQFEDGGKRVAVFSETPHGDMETSCQLYDTATGKRLAFWDPHSHTKEPKRAAPFHEYSQP